MRDLTLPPIHEDMTFFSWMSATHMMNGYPSAYQLSERLLGNGSSGTRLDFPSHLDNFCSNTSDAFGDIFNISKNTTVLPYYVAFRPTYIFENCVRLMASNSVENLKFILGLPPTRVNQLPSLKFCPHCFEQDIEKFGYGYWHRSHQLPSTHICTKHGEILHIFNLREDGRGKNELALPSLKNGHVIQASMNSLALLESLSNLSVNLLTSLLPGEFNAIQLQFTYQHGLKQQGLISSRGKIRVNEFLYQLQKYFHPILSISPYDRLFNKDNLQNFLKLVRKPRGFHHPVSHLLLIQFLFNSWDLFFATYKWERQFQLDLSPHTDPENTSLHYSLDDNLNEIAMQYKKGESLKKLAQEYNHDISAIFQNIEKLNPAVINKLPKSVSFEVRDHVFDLLKQGHDLRKVSEETSLSMSTIDRICASNPLIKEIWKHTKIINKREIKREKLMQFIADNPLTTKSAIRTSLSSTIQWLTTYDGTWLDQCLNNIKPAQVKRTLKASKPRINWIKRDEECLMALQKIKNIELKSWERRKPQAFLRKLPILSFKPRLSNLPKSKEWVTSALERLNDSTG